MDQKILASSINEAINQLIKDGPTPELLAHHRAELGRIINDAAPPAEHAIARLEEYYRDFFDRIVQHRGFPVREIASVDIADANSGRHVGTKGVGMEYFDSLEPRIRQALKVCTSQAAAEAEPFRRQHIADALDVFDDWAKSIPIGGTKEKSFREEARVVRADLKAAPRWDEYYFHTKSRNFWVATRNLAEEGNGAIAAEWHYTSSSDEEDHAEYKGKIYIVRESWAVQNGLIDVSNARFTDELPQPGTDGCECRYSYIYSLKGVPFEFLTQEGKNKLAPSKSASSARRGGALESEEDADESVEDKDIVIRFSNRFFKRYWRAIALGIFLLLIGFLATSNNSHQSNGAAPQTERTATSAKASEELHTTNASASPNVTAPCRTPDDATLLSPPLGYEVAGSGRLYFYTAPDERCLDKHTFVVPGDRLTAFEENGPWASVTYTTANGRTVEGWVMSGRLKFTGTMGRTERNQIEFYKRAAEAAQSGKLGSPFAKSVTEQFSKDGNEEKGSASIAQYSNETSLRSLVGKFPWEAFANRDFQELLAQLHTTRQPNDIAKFFEVSSPITLDSGYIVGEGCMVHACDNAGIFVLDLKSETLTLYIAQDGKDLLSWGTVTPPNNGARAIPGSVSRWFAQRNLKLPLNQAETTAKVPPIVPIEENAVIYTESNDKRPTNKDIKLINSAISLVKEAGYECNSVSALMPLILDTGVELTCDRFRHKYRIMDKGGRWVVVIE